MRASTGVAVVSAALSTVSGVEILAHGPLYRLDNRVAWSYWPVRSTSTTEFGWFLQHVGKPAIACLALAVAGLIAAWCKRRIEPIVAVTVGLGTVGIATMLLKHVFPRASAVLHQPGSFPSGHTGVAVVASGLIVYLLLPASTWRNAVALLFGAIWGGVMAWGRLVIEAHWLSDVLAGWGIGMVALVLAVRSADSPLGKRGWVRSTPADR